MRQEHLKKQQQQHRMPGQIDRPFGISQNKYSISGSQTSSTLSPCVADRKHAPTAEQRTQGRQQQNRLDIVDARAGSISSMSGTCSGSLTAITTGETAYEATSFTFTRRHGRRYLRDPTLPYVLPTDVPELQRQNLRTMLYIEVFGGPICSPKFRNEAPKKVFELGCGNGFWSATVHKHYTKLGCPPIEFTGMDIAPLAPNWNKEDGMIWNFVQGDFRNKLPFPDNEFDLVLSKDMATSVTMNHVKQQAVDEMIRILKPGGIFELWDSDEALRMLLPHTPCVEPTSEEEKMLQELANTTGTYRVTTQTPFATPQNQFLIDYNSWLTKIFDQRLLTYIPSTVIRAEVLQEAEALTNMGFRRLAIPLSEVRWEREGIGGYVKLGPDGQARISAKIKAKQEDKKLLTSGQAALRRTALEIMVQFIESLEPLLKEASGKGQDEWDRWWGSMMNDLLRNHGTSWGECLELGAWWATKRE